MFLDCEILEAKCKVRSAEVRLSVLEAEEARLQHGGLLLRRASICQTFIMKELFRLADTMQPKIEEDDNCTTSKVWKVVAFGEVWEISLNLLWGEDFDSLEVYLNCEIVFILDKGINGPLSDLL